MLALIEFHLIAFRPFLKFINIILNSSPGPPKSLSMWWSCVNFSSMFGLPSFKSFMKMQDGTKLRTDFYETSHMQLFLLVR